jgi:uncharacterized protein (TIGR02594 family)
MTNQQQNRRRSSAISTAPLPKQYQWLQSLEPLPRMLKEALGLLGTVEAHGHANSPKILGWAREIGGDIAEAYKADAIAWCGLFLAVAARRAGKTPPKAPLWALNWTKFGTEAGQPALGDVLVFVRRGGGHVALYVGEDQLAYHVLGGNQRDSVCFTRIAKERLRSARRPLYMNRPATVKPYILAASGTVSRNEA